ncbi:hypothetical protein SPF06_06365 [Sinomonas sp. JGH33]|uniref:Uncharacterized protein n=1 Tax=Sinomonas terricola TaxID=3110330 RepID=A0ABU5T440_9MICC|nr:hypothetical protein [Sinomonas sp. JGH33]MEA5454340.1 hypothetical protein [Sinomonas sp. JGH33]
MTANPSGGDQGPEQPDGAGPAAARSAPELWRRAFELVGSFGPPLTVATALLVYFGWARTDAQAKSMGLDASLFGYTVQDLVLRSIPSLYLPLVWLLLVGIAWLAVDRWVRSRIDAGRLRGALLHSARAVLPVGLALAAALWLVVLAAPGLSVLYVPYALAGSVLLASWGLSLRRALRASGPCQARRESHAVERILVFSVVSLLLFWGTSDYAEAVGRGLAVSIEQRVGTLPVAAVYSSKRLGLTAPGVAEHSLGTADAPLFRYTGLRLLVVSGGRIFLLHDGWTLDHGRVIVLPDDAGVRIEYGTASAPEG